MQQRCWENPSLALLVKRVEPGAVVMIAKQRRAGLAGVLLLVSIASIVWASTKTNPLPQAHAHNDYYHERPLLDALSYGFGSIEADVFCVDGTLLVGHDREELRAARTLEQLYFAPLAHVVKTNQGHVYGPTAPPLILLIDFKSAAEETYQALEPLLARYASILVHDVEGKRHAGAVQVIISGNRPFDAIASNSNRRAYIDGRLSDLSNAESRSWMPLISDRWGSHFQWDGNGPLEDSERVRVLRILETAHQQGRRVRFWATPDHADAWAVLHELGVDLINTDDLGGLAAFLKSRG